MSGSERLDFKAGPLGNLSQSYFGGLDMMVKGYEPALKGVSRWNLELFGLMARRAQAWLEISSRLSHCKTPVDVLNEQGKFWQTAAADYADSSQAAGGGVERMRDDAEAQWRASRATTSRSPSRRRARQRPSAASARRRESWGRIVAFARSNRVPCRAQFV